MATFTLYRGDRRVDLSTDQSYSAENIARIFQLSPSEIWLRERFGTRLYFPRADGMFDFSGVDEFTHLEVEGGSARASPTVTATPPTSRLNYPGFTPVVGQSAGRSRSSSSGTFSLKVIQARIRDPSSNGRPVFDKQGQHYVQISESTANVAYVNAAIQGEFGEDHLVVTSDGLEVKDSPGTQGLQTVIFTRRFFKIIVQYLQG